jgi:hypothetical protein
VTRKSFQDEQLSRLAISTARIWRRPVPVDADGGQHGLGHGDAGLAHLLVAGSFVGLGVAHFSAGRYAEAAHWLERGIVEHPSAVWTHRILCPAYTLGGRKAEAAMSLRALRAEYPDLTISRVNSALPLPRAVHDRVADGLDSLGVAAQ